MCGNRGLERGGALRIGRHPAPLQRTQVEDDLVVFGKRIAGLQRGANLGRRRDRRVHERGCSRVQAEIGSGEFAGIRGDDDNPRFGGGPAVRDLERHVIPFRVVQASARGQPLQSDVARDARHLDDAIGARLAGPLEQRGVRTVRQQPMQAVGAQQGRGRGGGLLPSGAGYNVRDGRVGERAEAVPRVTERAHLDIGMRNRVQQRANLRQALRRAVFRAPRASAC